MRVETVTIRDLIWSQPTESQYEILQRADRIGLPAGRYYMGQLHGWQVRSLTDSVEIKRSTRARIDAMFPECP